MPKDLPLGPTTEKNKLSTINPWLVLYELQISDIERIYLVNNEEEVTFASQSYKPFPIAFEVIEETISGDLPALNITVSNITREIQSVLEHRGGLLEKTVILRIVNSAHLDSTANAIEQTFTIQSVTANRDAVTFRLAQLPFFNLEWPHQNYSRTRCRFQFKGKGCKWGNPLPAGVQDSTTCDKTINGPNGCAFHGSLYTDAGLTSEWPERWGGMPSIPRRRV